MDVIDFFSSDQEPQNINANMSDGTRDPSSTDQELSRVKTLKRNLKKYEPIQDGNIIIKYEDDPVQYKRLRKKIQNRESSARIRGRKKGTMNSLEVQVQEFKKMNSELLLKNAELETENKALKNQVQFLRSIVKPQNQNIDKYLNIQQKSELQPFEQYQSPFQDDSSVNWIRSAQSNGSFSNWSTIFILTIAVCVFILPSDHQEMTKIAQEESKSATQATYFDLTFAFYCLKIGTKFLAGIGYLYLLCQFLMKKYLQRKKKKI